MGLANFLINLGNKYNKEKRNIDLTEDAFSPYIKDISVPTMVIQNTNDPMTNMDMVKQYFNNLIVEKEILWLDLENKRGASYAWLGKNSKPILDWYNKYL